MGTETVPTRREDPPDVRLLRASEAVRPSAGYLARHGVENPRDTAEALLCHLLGTDRAGLYARSDALGRDAARRLQRDLRRRCQGTPLQHLTEEQQFFDLVLKVRPGVFVPRPETEGLVEVAVGCLDGLRHPTVVDVGTGTGAVALAVKRMRPDATVLATDVSALSTRLARANARRLRLDVDVRLGDALAPIPRRFRRSIDVVVSNPPYLEPEEYGDLPPEVLADGYGALVGGTALHSRLAADAVGWLRVGGWLVLELGERQGAEVRGLLEAGGFTDVQILPDLAGRDRVVRGRVTK